MQGLTFERRGGYISRKEGKATLPNNEANCS